MTTHSDPIVDEIRKERKAHARLFDNNMMRIVAEYQRLQRQLGRELVSRPPRKPAEYRKPSAA